MGVRNDRVRRSKLLLVTRVGTYAGLYWEATTRWVRVKGAPIAGGRGVGMSVVGIAGEVGIVIIGVGGRVVAEVENNFAFAIGFNSGNSVCGRLTGTLASSNTQMTG